MTLLNKLLGEEPLFVTGRMLIDGEQLDLGNTGEYLIAYALEHAGIKGEKRIYRNLVVPKRGSRQGSTTEIDVLMLTEKGIYVFESKNYSGWIFGSVEQKNWTMVLNKTTKERFYNPIRQNSGHITALADLLRLQKEAFTSFIVFSERCELKKVPQNTQEVVICRRHNLSRDVKRHMAHNLFRLDAEQTQVLAQRLDEIQEASTEEVRRNHANQIKNTYRR